jgi:hypothetical protein
MFELSERKEPAGRLEIPTAAPKGALKSGFFGIAEAMP